MKIGIFVGSMQADSNSAKVGRVIREQLQEQGHSSFVLDLGKTPLPLWGSAEAESQRSVQLVQIEDELRACSGFVVISPEYHGMVPAALKNAFLFFDSEVLGHKPAYLIGVSAGYGGAYPIAELRLSSSKNNRLCYIPEHCIVRHAGQVLSDDAGADDPAVTHTRQRLRYGLCLLLEYAQALTLVRRSGVVDHERFANGM